MADFSSLVLTEKGRILQAKAQTGIQLHFSRVGLGDGVLTDAQRQNMKTLIALSNEVVSLNINALEITGDGSVKIRCIISNQGLAQGFYLREIGLFAIDPEAGEILYAVTNAGDYTDFLPAEGTVVVEETLEIITIIGNATNVVANVDSLVYATKHDIDKVDLKIINSRELINSLAVEVSILKNAAINNFNNNIFIETFDNLDSIKMTHGVFDKTGTRVVI